MSRAEPVALSLPRSPAGRRIPDVLGGPWGRVFLVGAAVGIAAIVALSGLKYGLAVGLAVLGVPLVVLAPFNLGYGLRLAIVAAFGVLGVKRVVSTLPLGIMLDLLLVILLLGVLLRQVRRRDTRLVRGPVSLLLLAWVFFGCVELFNPLAPSRLAWLFTVRALCLVTLTYFVALFTLERPRAIDAWVKLIVGLTLATALYGLFQEAFGLRAFELAWLEADERQFQLIYNWGRFRKFSFLSDPSAFGILMASVGLLTLILATGPFRRTVRLGLLLAGGTMLWAMVYSGTRTAFVLVPVGIVFYLMLTLNRAAILVAAGLALVGGFLLFGPIHGPNVERLRSAFDPAGSPSYRVRVDNHSMIRPFIRSHPIGAGMGTTGIWGERFSPHHWLASFPPDSDYVRIAVETGWIGLALYCTLMSAILWTGVRAWFAAAGTRFQVHAAAIVTALFCLVLGNMTQQVTTALPLSFVFWTGAAVLTRIRQLGRRAVGEATA